MRVRNPVVSGACYGPERSARTLSPEGHSADLLPVETLSFLLVEDHPIFVEGFSSAIQRLFPSASLTVVTCGAQARPLLRQRTFDLVFLDLNLPDISGFDLLREMQEHHFSQPVVILTAAVAPMVVEKAKRFGALGAFSKRVDHERLKQNCLRLLDGDPVFEAEPLLLSNADGQGYEPTGRELEVLLHLADGLDNAQICELLCVSDSTLRTHLRSLFFKLQVTNRTACVVKATRLGWI